MNVILNTILFKYQCTWCPPISTHHRSQSTKYKSLAINNRSTMFPCQWGWSEDPGISQHMETTILRQSRVVSTVCKMIWAHFGNSFQQSNSPFILSPNPSHGRLSPAPWTLIWWVICADFDCGPIPIAICPAPTPKLRHPSPISIPTPWPIHLSSLPARMGIVVNLTFVIEWECLGII